MTGSHGSIQVTVDQRYGDGAFAHGRCYPLNRPVPHVSGRKDAGHTSFQQHRRTLQRPHVGARATIPGAERSLIGVGASAPSPLILVVIDPPATRSRLPDERRSDISGPYSSSIGVTYSSVCRERDVLDRSSCLPFCDPSGEDDDIARELGSACPLWEDDPGVRGGALVGAYLVGDADPFG